MRWGEDSLLLADESFNIWHVFADSKCLRAVLRYYYLEKQFRKAVVNSMQSVYPKRVNVIAIVQIEVSLTFFAALRYCLYYSDIR